MGRLHAARGSAGARGGRRARAAVLLERSRLGGPLRRAPLWRGVVVLGYHRIGDADACPLDRTVYSATAEGFEAQLDMLARDVELIGLPDLDEALAGRRGRAVLLTFDDGYRDQVTVAAPILRARGLSALFFLVTDFLDGGRLAWWDELSWIARESERAELPADGELLTEPVRLEGRDGDAAARLLHERYRRLPAHLGDRFVEHVADIAGTGRPDLALAPWMSWDQARELRAAGHHVGAHTRSHPILARLDPERQRAEVEGSLDRLRAELGAPVECFAYPSGDRASFDSTTASIARAAGARWTFSFYGGWQRAGHADPSDIRRIPVFHDHPAPLVGARVSLPFLLGREAPDEARSPS